jgi:hypothetical protein
LVAFGDVAVGVVACGIFGYGILSISVVAVGVVAWGSVAVGLLLGMGGLALAPIAVGGAALGWFANGALAWGAHPLSPQVQDPVAASLFSPYLPRIMPWIFKSTLVAVPVFLSLGLAPGLMARIAERRARLARTPRITPDNVP